MGIQLGTARWTSTNPHPFAPAPGGGMGGLASTRWTSTVPTPFGPAPGAGSMGEVYNSGFAAQPVADPSISLEPEVITSKGPITVVHGPRKDGETPSLVISMRFTDRGAITQELLDKQIHAFLKTTGFKVSKAASFKAVNVSWRWGKMGAEAAGDVALYVPEVASGPYAGLRYAGAAYPEPLYQPSPQTLARMPRQIWVYTMAVTSAHNTMSDGDAAQALTLLKQAMINLAGSGHGGSIGRPGVIVTLRTCPSGIFGGNGKKIVISKPVKTGFSALLLLVAYNMISPHVGSEVL